MSATDTASGHATDATPNARLRFDVIDRRAKELGIETESALAEFLDLDWPTLWRYRRGQRTPGLETVLRIAERLDLKVEDIVARSGQ